MGKKIAEKRKLPSQHEPDHVPVAAAVSGFSMIGDYTIRCYLMLILNIVFKLYQIFEIRKDRRIRLNIHPEMRLVDFIGMLYETRQNADFIVVAKQRIELAELRRFTPDPVQLLARLDKFAADPLDLREESPRPERPRPVAGTRKRRGPFRPRGWGLYTRPGGLTKQSFQVYSAITQQYGYLSGISYSRRG